MVVESITQGVARKASLALGFEKYTFGVQARAGKPNNVQANQDNVSANSRTRGQTKQRAGEPDNVSANSRTCGQTKQRTGKVNNVQAN
jgi:hypothetical protein